MYFVGFTLKLLTLAQLSAYFSSAYSPNLVIIVSYFSFFAIYRADTKF